MQYVTAEHLRALDRMAVEQLGVSGLELMERAGAGAARAAVQLAEGLPGPLDFTILAGAGNNGGDGFVAARLLHAAGHRVRVWLTRPPERLRGDAAAMFDRLLAAGAAWEVVADPAQWRTPAMQFVPRGVCIDALLGTGSTGAPRGAVAAAIEWLRLAAQRSRILALDLPSGIEADTGIRGGVSVRADLTLTFGYPKLAMRRADLGEAFGRIEVLDIGLPPLPPAWAEGEDRLLAAPDWADWPLRRSAEAHKGDFGHVLVVGGSRGFGGAPLLCSLAALRAGAGRVSLLAPDPSLAAAGLAFAPEIMVHSLPDGGNGWSAEAWELWASRHGACDVVVAGPGMGVSDAVRDLIERLANTAPALVLDADGLNVWRDDAQALRRYADCLVLTPHPAEAARLLGTGTAEVQRDRPAAVRRLADVTGAVVVLKGAGTLVCAPGKRLQRNPVGNPGMATAGAGDVLAGVIGGLIGQGLDGYAAACLGVFLHASAGDLAARHGSRTGLIARDLIEYLGPACLRLQPR